MMRGIEAFHQEISSKAYRYMRPGLETKLGARFIGPFRNLIRLCERIETGSVPKV